MKLALYDPYDMYTIMYTTLVEARPKGPRVIPLFECLVYYLIPILCDKERIGGIQVLIPYSERSNCIYYVLLLTQVALYS